MAFVLLTGCGSKETEMTGKQKFEDAMKAHGVEIVDHTEEALEDSYECILTARAEGKYSFEYYYMDTPETAQKMYDEMQQKLNGYYSKIEDAEIWMSNNDTQADYSAWAEGEIYNRIIRDGNMMIYVTSPSGSAEEAKGIMTELGY